MHARNVLGIYHEEGKGRMKNFKQAFLNYSKAALKGHPHAQYNLGRCYHLGIGTEMDNRLSLFWFQKASRQDHPLSFLALAICHEYSE